MKFALPLILLLFALPTPTFGQAQNPCGSFQALINATYNFKPSRLSDAEREVKIAAMDRVWNMVRARPRELLPCLRAALEAPNADQWFLFNGSNLLVTVDPSPESKALQVRSYTAVDLDDVDLRAWVTTLALRGAEGFDVSAAGERWLTYPRARYFLPEHGAYQVGPLQGALFIFGSMDEAQATPALVRIVSQANHPGREHALLLLINQATPESLRALRQLDPSGFSAGAQRSLRALLTNPQLLRPRQGRPRSSREEFVRAFQSMVDGDWSRFRNLVAEVPDGEKDAVAVLRPEDLPLVRRVRRLMIANANQHAIEFYRDFTTILMALTWKPELVR